MINPSPLNGSQNLEWFLLPSGHWLAQSPLFILIAPHKQRQKKWRQKLKKNSEKKCYKTSSLKGYVVKGILWLLFVSRKYAGFIDHMRSTSLFPSGARGGKKWLTYGLWFGPFKRTKLKAIRYLKSKWSRVWMVRSSFFLRRYLFIIF